MFTPVLKFFGIRPELEVEIKENNEAIAEQVVEQSEWDRLQDNILENYISNKVEKELRKFCYTAEEIKQSEAAVEAIKKDHTIQSDYLIENEETQKIYKRRFPEAAWMYASSNYRRGVNKGIFIKYCFSKEKLVEKITSEVKQQVYEFEESKKNSQNSEV